MQMKRTLILLAIAAAALAPAAEARNLKAASLSRPFAIRTTDTGNGFSVDFPIVGRVRGASTTFFTALDITNNTSQPTNVDFFYTPADGSATTSGTLGTLQGFDEIQTDDFLQSLVDSGIISSNLAASTFGTLLLTFDNPTFTKGTEVSAVARIYSFVSGTSGPTFGLSYRANPLHTSGAHSLAGVARRTANSVTNLGVENVGIDDSGNAVSGPVTVQLSFFDPATGAAVGTQPTFNLAPGQMIQINDVINEAETNAFQFPAGTTSVIVFVDEVAGNSQISGYTVQKDIVTNDGSFVLMQESQTPF
jgi:hypothetical protein